MNKTKLTRRSAVTALLLVGALGSGIAIAAWTQTATGSGTAKAITATASTVTAATATADLYPGANGALYFQVNNPNPYQVTFTGLAPAGAVTASGSCPGTSADLTVNTLTTLSITVAAGATVSASAAGAVTMPATVSNLCQGATFTVPVTLSGTSS